MLRRARPIIRQAAPRPPGGCVGQNIRIAAVDGSWRHEADDEGSGAPRRQDRADRSGRAGGGGNGGRGRAGSRVRDRPCASGRGPAGGCHNTADPFHRGRHGGRADQAGRLAASDGGRLRFLTTQQPGGGAGGPALSADGRTVAFNRALGTCAGAIDTVPADGGRERTLIAMTGSGRRTAIPFDPSYSSDGKFLLYGDRPLPGPAPPARAPPDPRHRAGDDRPGLTSPRRRRGCAGELGQAVRVPDAARAAGRAAGAVVRHDDPRARARLQLPAAGLARSAG